MSLKKISIPRDSNNSSLYVSVIILKFSLTFLKNTRGWGEKLKTADFKLSFFELFMISLIINWWPKWIPSKFPIVKHNGSWFKSEFMLILFIIISTSFLYLSWYNILFYSYLNSLVNNTTFPIFYSPIRICGS